MRLQQVRADCLSVRLKRRARPRHMLNARNGAWLADAYRYRIFGSTGPRMYRAEVVFLLALRGYRPHEGEAPGACYRWTLRGKGLMRPG